MHSIDKVSAHILDSKLIPLFYEDDVTVVVEVVKALYAGGIRTIEFTNRGTKALENFKSPQNIPDTNINFAREKGLVYMKLLRDSCL